MITFKNGFAGTIAVATPLQEIVPSYAAAATQGRGSSAASLKRPCRVATLGARRRRRRRQAHGANSALGADDESTRHPSRPAPRHTSAEEQQTSLQTPRTTRASSIIRRIPAFNGTPALSNPRLFAEQRRLHPLRSQSWLQSSHSLSSSGQRDRMTPFGAEGANAERGTTRSWRPERPSYSDGLAAMSGPHSPFAFLGRPHMPLSGRLTFHAEYGCVSGALRPSGRRRSRGTSSNRGGMPHGKKLALPDWAARLAHGRDT
jgi:hypothetical protein